MFSGNDPLPASTFEFSSLIPGLIAGLLLVKYQSGKLKSLNK
jgi:hypothetical protein